MILSSHSCHRPAQNACACGMWKTSSWVVRGWRDLGKGKRAHQIRLRDGGQDACQPGLGKDVDEGDAEHEDQRPAAAQAGRGVGCGARLSRRWWLTPVWTRPEGRRFGRRRRRLQRRRALGQGVGVGHGLAAALAEAGPQHPRLPREPRQHKERRGQEGLELRVVDGHCGCSGRLRASWRCHVGMGERGVMEKKRTRQKKRKKEKKKGKKGGEPMARKTRNAVNGPGAATRIRRLWAPRVCAPQFRGASDGGFQVALCEHSALASTLRRAPSTPLRTLHGHAAHPYELLGSCSWSLWEIAVHSDRWANRLNSTSYRNEASRARASARLPLCHSLPNHQSNRCVLFKRAVERQ